MNIVFLVVVVVFIVAVLALVGYAIYEVTPFARHADHYRDPYTGERRWNSPHLED